MRSWLLRLRTFLLLFLLGASLLIGCGDTQAKPSDPDLEQKVLEIIRKNPQVIIDSVQKYQEAQVKEERKAVYKQVASEPRLLIRNSPVTGAPEGKVVLAEFSDFQCPYCRQAHATVKAFMAKHKSQVTLTYKHFPLTQAHPEALPAARASWAANQQKKFWEYHDQLFEQQEKLGESLYTEIAQKLSLDLEKFNRDRNSPESEAAIQEDYRLGRALGVNGTPAFFMNDEFFSGAVSLENMEQTLSTVQASLSKK